MCVCSQVSDMEMTHTISHCCCLAVLSGWLPSLSVHMSASPAQVCVTCVSSHNMCLYVCVYVCVCVLLVFCSLNPVAVTQHIDCHNRPDSPSEDHAWLSVIRLNTLSEMT